MGFLQGKRALIVGLASERSIAHGIATAMHREGAELAFFYQNERLKTRVESMAGEWQSQLTYVCDVAEDASIAIAFKQLATNWDSLDILVHSVAYAPADQLEGEYASVVTREGFRIAHEISSYSFAALAKAAKPLMEGRQSALLTLSYLGAEKAISHYNVMGLAKASLEANVRYLAASLGPHGIRVNGISAGPIRTLAAAGIKQFRQMLAYNAKVAPLRRNIDQLEVGNAAAFLCSDLASAITGEIVHVDAGFSQVGLEAIELT